MTAKVGWNGTWIRCIIEPAAAYDLSILRITASTLVILKGSTPETIECRFIYMQTYILYFWKTHLMLRIKICHGNSIKLIRHYLIMSCCCVFNDLRSEVVVCLADIVRIVNHHFVNFLFIKLPNIFIAKIKIKRTISYVYHCSQAISKS